MKFSYNWKLSDGYPEKNGLKVFSCFAGGGGSTMGYKLAGYDVIGMNEIDPRMASIYLKNHHPTFGFIQPIQEFKNSVLPKELFDLDILDGSPPCSSFSMSGNRSKDWGKEKKFREGQADQILDTLFFDFIDLAERLRPKVCIAENVTGILAGEAREYVRRIIKRFEDAGYQVKEFVLDASKMGVPQRRKRVFFIAIRRDLSYKCPRDMTTLFNAFPALSLDFSERPIPFREIEDPGDLSIKDDTKVSTLWDLTEYGDPFSTVHAKGHFFNDNKADPDKVIPTITADPNHGTWHYDIKRMLNDKELIRAGSFPADYDFGRNKIQYVVGMSVPPVMVAQIADQLTNQWFKYLKDVQPGHCTSSHSGNTKHLKAESSAFDQLPAGNIP